MTQTWLLLQVETTANFYFELDGSLRSSKLLNSGQYILQVEIILYRAKLDYYLVVTIVFALDGFKV